MVTVRAEQPPDPVVPDSSVERLKVFVSSVMGNEDLSRERDAAVDAINSLKLTVGWAFEHSPAEPSSSSSVYLREVVDSDLVIVIISNSHSDAVQSELDLADANGKPILAFVRRLTSTETTTERLGALRWLGNRIKYAHFSGLDDLRREVVNAVAAELVRGYKRYRIAQGDYAVLLESVGAPPSLIVRDAERRDLTDIKAALYDLRDLYPEIGAWTAKVLSDVGSRSSEIRVAELAGEIAGLAISRDKDSRVRKFSTIYVRPGFRGDAVGPHLVHEEVRRAAADGVRKAYVTFANELASSIGPILQRYGFVTEGIASGRYRAGAAEWVMAKTFCYGSVGSGDFASFVEDHLAREFGCVIEQRCSGAIRLGLPEKVFGLPSSGSIWLVHSTSPQPEADFQEWSSKFSGEPWLFCSLYGRQADGSHWSQTVTNWIDGEDLRARYHPLDVISPEQSSLLCTIKPKYADAILPRRERPALFAPDRLQIRPDNVYYRTPDRYQQLRRGSALLFYVSAPESALRGSSRVQSLLVESPEECLSVFGSMGIYEFGDLRKIAEKHRGRVLSLAFDWYTQHDRNLSWREIKQAVPRFNPAGAVVLSEKESRLLREVSLA